MGRLTKEAAEDRRIMDENPNAKPKELLALGLSQAGYEKLMAEQEETGKSEAKTEEPAKAETKVVEVNNDEHGPVMPKVEKQSAAVPKLQAPVAVYDGDMVTVAGNDGSQTRMTRAAAERFLRGGRNANFRIL